MSNETLKKLEEAILDLDVDLAEIAAKKVLEAGIDPVTAMNTTMSKCGQIIGDKFDDGSFFLPHLVMAGEAMEAAGKILENAMKSQEMKIKKVVVFATVEGDQHSIGKNIVSMMLKSSGLEVHDLGIDQKSMDIIKRAVELKADFIALSSLLSTTMPYLEEVIKELETQGLRDNFKVVVGGGPVTIDYAEKIGADGYAKDAIEAVQVFRELIAKDK